MCAARAGAGARTPPNTAEGDNDDQHYDKIAESERSFGSLFCLAQTQ